MTAVKSYLTNFPAGMTTDIGIRNLPAIVTNSGRNLWIDSNGPGASTSGGSNLGKRGTYQRPYASVAQLLGPTVGTGIVQNNDTIWMKAGHAETISAAGGWTWPSGVTGVRVIGIGFGEERPQITFSTSTAATALLDAAGAALINFIGICNINSQVSPFVVSAAGCTFAGEWRDATSHEALRAILTTAGAVRCNFDLKYVGLSGSSVNVNAFRLVGSANNRINIDYFGTPSTGVVEFFTTAATNTDITGIMNNSNASTTHAHTVVDTVTGSHYSGYWRQVNSSSTDTAPYQVQA
jgi:hypothetical protein